MPAVGASKTETAARKESLLSLTKSTCSSGPAIDATIGCSENSLVDFKCFSSVVVLVRLLSHSSNFWLATNILAPLMLTT